MLWASFLMPYTRKQHYGTILGLLGGSPACASAQGVPLGPRLTGQNTKRIDILIAASHRFRPIFRKTLCRNFLYSNARVLTLAPLSATAAAAVSSQPVCALLPGPAAFAGFFHVRARQSLSAHSFYRDQPSSVSSFLRLVENKRRLVVSQLDPG